MQPVIQLVVLKRANQGPLMLPQYEFGNELRRSQIRDVLDDVDLVVQFVKGFLVSFIAENALAPPKWVRFDAATAAFLKEPCEHVLSVCVVEFATVDDGALYDLVGFFPVGDGWLILISLRRGWIDTANQRLLEAEVLIIRYAKCKCGPNHRGETTDES